MIATVMGKGQGCKCVAEGQDSFASPSGWTVLQHCYGVGEIIAGQRVQLILYIVTAL